MKTNKGLFLRDFFGRILPGDRNLFTPILEFLKWRRLTKNLGLLSWVALWLAVCGLLSFSFIKNVSVLKGFTEDFSKPPALAENIADNLRIMDKFRSELLELIDANEKWWVPRLGLNESRAVEKKLKKEYVSFFEKGFLDPMDRAMEKKLQLLTPETPGSEIMVYAEHLVSRIILIRDHLEGKNYQSSDYVFRILPRVLTIIDTKLLPEIAAKFGDIYFYYLDWGVNDATARSKMKELQIALLGLFGRESSNLYWLTEWANNDGSIRDVTLEDFWGPADSKKARHDIVVKRAFTVDGYKIINEFMAYLEVALTDLKEFKDKKEQFYRWYQQKYFQAWKGFAGSFSQGQLNLDGPDEWQTMTATMTTAGNPYFAIIKMMREELQSLADGSDVPAWAKHLVEVQSIIDDASKEKRPEKDATVLARATQKGKALVHKVVKETKALADNEQEEKRIAAAKAFNTYLEDLEALLPVSTARSQAYKAASEFFPYSLKPSDSKSPFFAAFGEVQKFKSYLATAGDSSVVLQLLSGPLRFLLFYVSMETACSLQQNWEDVVLGGIQGVAPEKMPAMLFGQQGLVWTFVQGQASPFMGRSQHGYFAKEARGARIPFNNAFFSFVTQGSEVSTSIQSEYKVKVTALPIDVNDGAKKEPYQVSLELQCVDKKEGLRNYNYPTSSVFTWSPDGCGDVTMQIWFEGFSLSKKYAGHNGFPLFLSDFRDGSKTFTPDDFPQSKEILEKLDIRTIKVSYEFIDSKPVIQLLEKVPKNVPTMIVTCWDH